jgi:hypothetical protein
MNGLEVHSVMKGERDPTDVVPCEQRVTLAARQLVDGRPFLGSWLFHVVRSDSHRIAALNTGENRRPHSLVVGDYPTYIQVPPEGFSAGWNP